MNFFNETFLMMTAGAKASMWAKFFGLLVRFMTGAAGALVRFIYLGSPKPTKKQVLTEMSAGGLTVVFLGDLAHLVNQHYITKWGYNWLADHLTPESVWFMLGIMASVVIRGLFFISTAVLKRFVKRNEK